IARFQLRNEKTLNLARQIGVEHRPEVSLQVRVHSRKRRWHRMTSTNITEAYRPHQTAVRVPLEAASTTGSPLARTVRARWLTTGSGSADIPSPAQYRAKPRDPLVASGFPLRGAKHLRWAPRQSARGWSRSRSRGSLRTTRTSGAQGKSLPRYSIAST